MPTIPKSLSEAEAMMAMHLDIYKVPYVRELQFAKEIGRKWRADFALLESRILIEVDGGTWNGGRHTRGSGFEQDCYKVNQATLMGWRVLRFTCAMVISGNAIDTVCALMKIVQNKP
jgi:very-short-patch-repair endonuclease